MKKEIIFASCWLLSCAQQDGVCQSNASSPSGPLLTQRDIDNATPIRTFTPQEFAHWANAQVKCNGSILLSAYTPENGFALDGAKYSKEEFAKEVVRRHVEKPFRCLEIAATCQSMMLVARLMMAVKSANLEQINLHADEKIFPSQNAKLPECPK